MAVNKSEVKVCLENKIRILKATYDSGIGLYIEDLHTLAEKENISVLELEKMLDILKFEGFLQFYQEDQRYVNTGKEYYGYVPEDLNDITNNYNDYIKEGKTLMEYIESPCDYNVEDLSFETKLFIAGGITKCPDWQQILANLLFDSNLTIFNPRRHDFPIGDPSAALKQITWEHHALRAANLISFWFPKETICPIVLYELGAFSMTDKHILVGLHPEYQRRQDVEIQTKLVRPEVEIVYDLDSLRSQISSEVIKRGV